MVTLTSSQKPHSPDDSHERPEGVPKIRPSILKPNIHISLKHSLDHHTSISTML